MSRLRHENQVAQADVQQGPISRGDDYFAIFSIPLAISDESSDQGPSGPSSLARGAIDWWLVDYSHSNQVQIKYTSIFR